MNHIYRVVWNAASMTWTAVSELAQARGKHGGRRVAAAALAAALAPAALAGNTPSATVASGSGSTRAYTAPNGTTVVNIDTANAAGLSVNRFTSYNVDAGGLVLNNTTTAQAAYQSQLAGQVMANQNLDKSASVILNEVVSNNRSTLAGFTEVLGGKADVVLANPYGITCSGCGFINTDRVTLTTGTPYLDADGSLGGFKVSQGDILVSGNGLNATAQQVLDLVTRSVKLDGAINAQTLGITAGANQWDYASRSVVGSVAPTGSAPTYAIDSSALGGMYADRIVLTATEAGVGVRMLGDAAANSDDFTLTAAGPVALQGRVSAQRNLDVDSSAGGIALSGATLSAGSDIGIDAGQGGASLTGGAIVAGADLAVSAASLADAADSSGIANDNVRSAGGTLSLDVAGTASLGATQWLAGGAWQGRFGSLSAGTGTQLLSHGSLAAEADGDIALGAAAVQSAGDLSMDAGGLLTMANLVESTGGDVQLAAANGLDNGGTISADAGSATLRIGGSLGNGGTVQAAQALDIADAAGAGGETLSNQGTLLAGGTLSIRAAALSNAAGGIVQSTGGSMIRAVSLGNDGTLLLSTQAGADDLLAVDGDAVNTGVIQSAGDVALSAGSLDNSGTVSAAGALSASSAGDVANADGGIVQAGGALSVDAAGSLANAAQGTLQGGSVVLDAGKGLDNAGVVYATGGGATLRADGSLDNSGYLQASQGIDIADRAGGGSEDVSNSGYLLAGGTLALKAAVVANAPGAGDPQSGWVQANGSTIQAASLSNGGTWLLSQQADADDALTVANTLTNTGTLQSGGNASLAAGSIANQGTLLAAGDLSASTAGDFANAGSGVAVAGGDLSVDADGRISNTADAGFGGDGITLAAVQGLDNAGVIVAAGDATLKVGGSFANSGTVQAGDAMEIAGDGAGQPDVDNSGSLLAAGALDVQAGHLTNAQGAHIQAKATTVQATDAYNAGIWVLSTQSGGTSRLELGGTLTNTATGILYAMGPATYDVAGLDNEAGGLMYAAGDLAVNLAGSGDFDNGGTIQSDGTLGIAAPAAALLNEAGARLIGNQLAVSGASLDNGGVMQGGAGTASTVGVAGQFTNESGAVFTMAADSAGGGTLSAAAMVNHGTLQSVGDMALAVGNGGLDSDGLIVTNGGLAIRSLSGNDYAATIAGDGLSSGGLLKIDGDADSTLSIADGVTVAGGTADIALGTVDVGQGAALMTDGDMALTVSNLSVAGAADATSATGLVKAALSGTGTGTLSIGNAFSNAGLLFSGQDLSVSAPSITNGTTGGIAALRNLTVTADGGDLLNEGTLYAGGTLTANATQGTLTNAASAASGTAGDDDFVPAAYLGYISAGGALDINVDTLENNSLINSTGDLSITANTIRNEVLGGDDRVWVTGATTTTQMGDEQKWDGHNGYRQRWNYEDTWDVWQEYANGSQTGVDGSPKLKPQIVAGGSLSASFGSELDNLGGVISGQTVTLTGTGSDAKLVNDDLALDIQHHVSYYNHYIHWQALVGASDTYNDTGWYSGNCASGDDCGASDDSVMSEDAAKAAGEVAPTTEILQSIGAGIFATTLRGSGFALSNDGSTAAAVTQSALDAANAGSPGSASLKTVSDSRTASDDSATASAVAAGGGVSGTAIGKSAIDPVSASAGTLAGGASFVDGNEAAGVSGTSFGGINLPLPSNPNGLYVQTKSSDAQYLVESNPLYTVGSTAYGSDYMATQLGYNPDQLGLRLGDDSYENYLVQQELVSQTGNVLLAEYQSADAQMLGLMDSAVSEASSLGLVYGAALTAEQQAGLTKDIVWMVQTVVDGKTVLAPVVYLCQATRDSIAKGAVISAQDADLSLTSLTNTGGTISGGKSLSVVSTGDITNLSGLIQGGDVSLSSTQGSIVNQTAATGGGNSQFYTTDIGKTAGIAATGALSLNAAKDITNLGAQVSAGTDASLKAGGDITFDTIQDKTADTAISAFHADGGSGQTITTTTTVQQVQSGLTVGGNLAASAGNDITLAGTNADVGGNADLAAGGDINIVERENTTDTHSVSHASGFGMNDSLYGSTTVTTDTSSGRSVGSTLDVGGDASLAAGKDITVQGSNVNVAGNGTLDADNVNVLAADNYDTSHTVTKQTGIMQVSASGGGSKEGDASAGASSGKLAASAQTDASGDASGSGSAGLAFYSGTTTTTDTSSDHHVGSSLSFGGDADINAKNDVTLQGSTIAAGGDANVNAANVNLLSAADTSTSSTTTTHTSVGLMTSTQDTVSGEAGALASASTNGLPGASAGASASASADSENHIDLVQHSTSTASTLDITHQGSAITAGHDVNVDASGDLTLQGSSMSAGNDMNLKAANQSMEAVDDVHETSTSSSTTTAGFYVSGHAEANASASGTASLGAQGGASADASATGSAGLYGSNTRTSSVDGSTTAVTSSLSAGHDMTRTASGNITDEGTQISAGNDFTQTAQSYTSKAASDTTYGSSSTATDTAKVGVYATASASASVEGSVGPGSSKPQSTDADKGAGVSASYEHSDESSTYGTSTAVVSNIHVGGNASMTTTGATSLEGTNIDAGGNATLNAGSLDYAAAKNTSDSTGKSNDGSGSVSVDVVNKSGSASVSYEGSSSEDHSSTAVTGGITSGGNLSINTAGDATLEGTNLSSGGATGVDVGGSLDFKAAKNTSSSTSQGESVGVSVTAGGDGSNGEGSVDVSHASSNSDQDVAGSIQSGGPVTVTTGKDATFTGTAISSGQDVTVAAGGNLAFNAAHDVESSTSVEVGASGSGEKGQEENVGGTKDASTGKKTGGTTMDERSGAGSASVGYSASNSDTASGASITSTGGSIKLSSGGDTTLQGTAGSAAGSIAIDAGGKVDQQSITSTSSTVGVNVGASASASTKTPAKGTSASGTSTTKSGASASSAGSGSGTSKTAASGSAAGASKTAASGGAAGTSKTAASGSAAGTSKTAASGSAAGTSKTAASGSAAGASKTTASGSATGASKTSATGSATNAQASSTGATTTQPAKGTVKKGSGVATLQVDNEHQSKTTQTTLQAGQGVTINEGSGSDGGK